MNYTVKDENVNSSTSVSERADGKGLIYLDVDVSFDKPTAPEPVTVSWKTECTDIYSVWSANTGFNRLLGVTWAEKECISRLAYGSPIHALVSFSGQNRMTVSVSDAATPIKIATGVCEETSEIICSVTFFDLPVAETDSYKATIRIDKRDITYSDAVKSADRFLADYCGYPSAYIPDLAKRPMYSTWYSFHQSLSPDEVIEQCKMAKELGMESVIVDDGWQTDDNSRGYAFCGDWKVYEGKIPDMKAFVDAIHEIGMKFILWYSVPYVGVHSDAYARFKGMYLDDSGSCAVLDPRYPEVRKYLTEIYLNAKKAWGLDGFKLDFIDDFKLTGNTKSFDERWDTVSLEDGIDRLLKEVTESLKAIDPEILIEFRQSYFGPAIRKYGNMIRVADCPNDSLANLVFGTNMKFQLDKTPVHSDMLMWNTGDTVESAAHQLLCSLFLVPQISVHIDKIPSDHYKMLRFMLDYWNQHRDILVDGNFSAESHEHLYTQTMSEKDGYIIMVAHADSFISVDKFDNLDIFNATGSKKLAVSVGCGNKHYRITDCMGNEKEAGTVDLSNGVRIFEVPLCGLLRIY